MVGLSKIVTYTSSILFATYFINKIYDSYSDYVAEEGYKVEDIFGGSDRGSSHSSQHQSSQQHQQRGGSSRRGGSSSRGGRQQQQRGNKNQQDPDVLRYNTLRRQAEEAIHEEDLPLALEICEELYEVIKSSSTLMSQDRGNTLYLILRLSNVTNNSKKLAKYAPMAIDLQGPNPFGDKLSEIVDLIDVIVKDKLEDKKYDEALATVKMYLKRYNTYRPEHISALYSLLGAIYRQMDSQQEFYDSAKFALEMARKSNDQNALASALVDLLDYHATKGDDESILNNYIQEILPLFPTNEQKLTIYRIICPILLSGKYLDKYIEFQTDLTQIFESKVKSVSFTEDDRVKLQNHVLREKVSLASALLIAGKETEAMELFDKVKNDEFLTYTLSSLSAFYKTKEASISLGTDDQVVFSVKIEVPEKPQKVLEDDLVAVCKFENPKFLKPATINNIVVEEVKEELKQEVEQQEEEEEIEKENKVEEQDNKPEGEQEQVKAESEEQVKVEEEQKVEENNQVEEVEQKEEQPQEEEEQKVEQPSQEQENKPEGEQEQAKAESDEQQQPQEQENKPEEEEQKEQQPQEEEENKVQEETINVEKKAEKEMVFETAVGKDVDPSKSYYATIYIYKGDDRENVISKHVQILSPRIPIKGLPEEDQQKIYF